jgi:hypothetical protein
MAIFLVLLIKTFHKRPIQITAASLAIFALTSINFVFTVSKSDPAITNINTYQQMYERDMQSGRFALQKKMQSDISLNNSPIDIIQDYTLPTAWSGFRTGVTLTYSYDDWDVNISTISGNTIYLFFDKSKHKVNILGTDADNSIYSDSDIEALKILRTQKFGNRNCDLKSETRDYFLLKCSP